MAMMMMMDEGKRNEGAEKVMEKKANNKQPRDLFETIGLSIDY